MMLVINIITLGQAPKLQDGSSEKDTRIPGTDSIENTCQEATLPECDCEYMDQQVVTFLVMGGEELVGHFRLCQIQATEKMNNTGACRIEIEDVVGPVINHTGINESYIAFACTNRKRIVFTNWKNKVNKNIVSVLQLKNCDMYWKDISRFGQSMDLRVLMLLGWKDEFAPNAEDVPLGSCLDTEFDTSEKYNDFPQIKGLETVGSLCITHPNKEIHLSPVVTGHMWPVMSEVQFINVSLDQSSINKFQKTMPVLQSFEYHYGNINIPPHFPWYQQNIELPRNLSRTKEVQESHYAGPLNINCQPYHYRRVLNLSFNHMPNLTGHVFKGFLHRLDLRSNSIYYIGYNTFTYLRDIQIINLSNNSITVLPGNTFGGLHSLKTLDLSHNNVTHLASKSFYGLLSLTSLLLQNNRIKEIEFNAIAHAQLLAFIDLSQNEIENISDNAVDILSVKSLTNITLKDNKIKNMPPWIFLIRKLVEVDISSNMIDFEAFVSLLNNLQFNKLQYENTLTASSIDITFKPATEKYIILQDNSVTKMNINRFNETTMESFTLVWNYFKIDFSYNDIVCDCTMFPLYQVLRTEMEKPPDFHHRRPRISSFYMQHLVCYYPEYVRGTPVVDVKETVFRCAENMDNCPKGCICYRRTIDQIIMVESVETTLTDLPIYIPTGTTHLSLKDNHIKKIDLSIPGYIQDLVMLNLSSNKLSSVSATLLTSMPSGGVIDLRHNMLETMPKELDGAKNIPNIFLSGNNFICDCTNVWFHNWLVSHIPDIPDAHQVTCFSGKLHGRVIIEANVEDFICIYHSTVTVAITVVLATLIAVILILLPVYRYNREIQVYVNHRFNWRPFDQDETEVDGKEYDAFISYNVEDSDWVEHTLCQGLEDCDPPYKLCIHKRDFRAGTLIQTNIAISIAKSRRMVMVLSDNFLQSDWCKIEFRSAHLKALQERSNYLIVIVLNEVSEDDLDEEMKLYLTTNTYIRVDSKWFWENLKYALPKKTLSQIQEENNDT